MITPTGVHAFDGPPAAVTRVTVTVERTDQPAELVRVELADSGAPFLLLHAAAAAAEQALHIHPVTAGAAESRELVLS